MSRAAMTVAGLDFVKWDDEKQRGAWGRCCNAYPLTVELADSGRLMGNNWNITTATFMRRCVVRRVRLRMYSSTAIVVCMSALDVVNVMLQNLRSHDSDKPVSLTSDFSDCWNRG